MSGYKMFSPFLPLNWNIFLVVLLVALVKLFFFFYFPYFWLKTLALTFFIPLELPGIPLGNYVSHLIYRLCFLVVEVCLVAGSVRNAYHTKYFGYFEKKDLTSCIALRKGVFAVAAAFVLISLVSSLSFYWSYAKSNPAGWVKHQNEGGVGMAEYGQDKGELRTFNI